MHFVQVPLYNNNFGILLNLFYFVYIGHSTTSNGSNNIGPIIGGIVGGIVGVIIVVAVVLLLFYYFYIGGRKQNSDESRLIQSKHCKYFLMHS